MHQKRYTPTQARVRIDAYIMEESEILKQNIHTSRVENLEYAEKYLWKKFDFQENMIYSFCLQ